MAQVVIRPGRESHRAFILDAFQSEYRECCYADECHPSVLIPKMEALLDNGWLVSVATPADDADVLFGYVVFRRPNQVAWLHVKRPFRGAGVGKALWAATEFRGPEIECAFQTPRAVKALAKLGMVPRFRPYLPDVVAYEAAGRQAQELAEGAIADAPIRKQRADFDPSAAPTKSANDTLAEIRRLAQWRISTIQAACRDRPPTEEQLDTLAKAGRLLIALDKPVTEPNPRERSLTELTDLELERAAR